MARYFGKFGELRIYSSTSAGTSGLYYFQVAFCQMNLSIPFGRPRPEEIFVLDRGVMNSFAHHIQGTDAPIVSPTTITFSAELDETINRTNFVRAMGNPENVSPWSVGIAIFSHTNGRSTQFNGAGSAISTPLPYDPLHKRMDLAVIWKGNPLSTPGTDYGFMLKEVYFPPGQLRLQESDGAVTVNVTGMHYGSFSAISAFPAGVDVSR